VTAAGLTLEGDPVTEEALPAQLQKHLSRIAKIESARGGDAKPWGILIVVAPDAPFSSVVSVTRIVTGAGMKDAYFAFRRATRIERPAASPVDAELKAARDAAFEEFMQPPTQTDTTFSTHIGPFKFVATKQFDAVLAKVLGPCPALVTKVGNNGAALGDVLFGASATTDECRCRIDQPSLRALLWTTHPAQQIAARHVVLAGGAKSAPIEAPGATTWKDVAPKLIALPDEATVTLQAK
jgi:hypothetical protein